MADKKYSVIKPMRWDGKNVSQGDSISLGDRDARWLLARGAVSETKAKKAAAKK